MRKKSVFSLLGLALACLYAVTALAGEPAAKRETPPFIKASKDHFRCIGIGVIDVFSERDGPLYYFHDDSREIISVCGGACWHPQGEQVNVCKTLCPPPGWTENTCGRKFRAYKTDRLPTPSEAEMFKRAHQQLGCHLDIPCKVTGGIQDGLWVFNNEIRPTGSTPEEQHRAKWGNAQVVFNLKGQSLGYTNFDGRVVRYPDPP